MGPNTRKDREDPRGPKLTVAREFGRTRTGTANPEGKRGSPQIAGRTLVQPEPEHAAVASLAAFRVQLGTALA